MPFPKQRGVCWCLDTEAGGASWKALLRNAREVLSTPYEMHETVVGMSLADLVLFRLL